MQRHELDAWFGTDHELTEDQVTELHAIVNEIEERYPDPDDQDDRNAAMSTAYRLFLNQDEVLDELAVELIEARAAEATALAGLRQAAQILIPSGRRTEAGFARQAGVDRQAVRKWLGKKR